MKVQLDTPNDRDLEICAKPTECQYCNQLFRSSPRILLERWVKSVVKETDIRFLYSLEVTIPHAEGTPQNRGLDLIEELVGQYFNYIPYIYNPYLDDLKSVIQFDYDLNEDNRERTDLTVTIYMVGLLPYDMLDWTKHISDELSKLWYKYKFKELGEFRDEHDLFALVFPMFPSKDTLEVIFKDGDCPFGLNLEDRALLLHNCLPINMMELTGPNPTITHFDDLRNDVLKPLLMRTYEIHNGLITPPLCGLFTGEWREAIDQMSFWGPFEGSRT